MKQELKNITELISNTNGIDVSRFDESFMQRILNTRISETGSKSFSNYFSVLSNNKKEREIFIDKLHINYSEFFRNPLTFACLERNVIPALARKMENGKRKEVRVWSTACAEGQETYSLAMLFEEYGSSEKEKLSYRIFATDSCETNLEFAKNAVYRDSDIECLMMRRINSWFVKQGKTYTIKSELKINIDFSVFDLIDKKLSCPEASIFGDFDIVFCANLLFYYKPEFRERILTKISKCINSGGYVITGETEREILLNNNFHEVFPNSAIFQKR